MSEFENAAPKREQELKDRTDEAIRGVGALPDEELGQVAGGDCTIMSGYGCINVECDVENVFDCLTEYLNH